MDPAVQRDLVERLTSRKFIVCLLVIVLAFVGWATGNLAYADMVQVALWVAGIFTGFEGLGDAAGRLGSRPQPIVPETATTINVNTPPAPDPSTDPNILVRT